MNSFVVIYTDYGCTCDGLARVTGTYKTLKEAQEAMRIDANMYREYNPLLDITEEDDKHIFVGDIDNGSLVQILEISNE